MSHQRFDRSQIVLLIQKSCGEGMPHDVRMNPLPNQGLLSRRFDEAINSFWGQAPFLIRSVLPQCSEEGMSMICSIPGSFQVVLYGDEGVGIQGDAPEFLAFADNVNDGLIPVGLEILDLEVAEFGFPQRFVGICQPPKKT